MSDERQRGPAEEVRALYEDAEAKASRAFEQLVSLGSFGELLARATENVVGLTKIGSDVFDLVLRNLRLAGRQDITRLARQLARTEDKLELLLQEVERLNERGAAPTGRATSRRHNGQKSRTESGS